MFPEENIKARIDARFLSDSGVSEQGRLAALLQSLITKRARYLVALLLS